MKKLGVLICVIVIFVLTSNAQEKPLADLVRENSYPIVVSEKKLSGKGAELLTAKIKEAQFLVLGENHNSAKLSEFTEALFYAKDINFTHFILEIGPIAAQKIYNLYDQDISKFTGNLNKFLDKYKFNDAPPIEFVAMKADAGMLDAAIRSNVRIVGIDKEYTSSTFYLLDELRTNCRKQSDIAKWQKVKDQVDEIYRKKQADKKVPFFSTLYQDNNFIQTLRSINPGNRKAAEIINEFVKVLYIYGLYDLAKYSEQNSERLKIMKVRLGTFYAENLKANKAFKGFIKIGNNHTNRGLNSMSLYDIGNTASELAEMSGSKSINIFGMRRYRQSESGEVMDFLKDGYEPYSNFINQTDKENFVLIDLKPIRELYLRKKIKIDSKEEIEITLSNDFVLLTPIDKPYKSSLNYNKN